MSTLWLVNVQLPKGKKIKKAENLFKFVWDKEQKNQTFAEMKNVMKVIASATKNNKKRKRKK